MPLDIEQWKPIVGFQFYEVSNFGRVRRTTTLTGKPSGRILKPSLVGGYAVVKLSEGGKSFNRKVHRLVAQAFVRNRVGPDAEVHHKDKHKPNNRASNLQWMSPDLHDALHPYQHDALRPCPFPRGEAHHKAKLNELQVAEIRARHAQGGIMQRALADDYGVSIQTVNHIILGKIWKWIA